MKLTKADKINILRAMELIESEHTRYVCNALCWSNIDLARKYKIFYGKELEIYWYPEEPNRYKKERLTGLALFLAANS